jgi:hypothetical protein
MHSFMSHDIHAYRKAYIACRCEKDGTQFPNGLEKGG